MTPNNNVETLRKEKKDQSGAGFFPFSTPNPSKLQNFLAENRSFKNQREELGEEDDERNDDTFGDYDEENEDEVALVRNIQSHSLSLVNIQLKYILIAIGSTIIEDIG